MFKNYLKYLLLLSFLAVFTVGCSSNQEEESIDDETVVEGAVEKPDNKKQSKTTKRANENSNNVTSIKGKKALPEKYTLEVVAPKIDNNVFPVPVKYFDDLLTHNGKLKAVLMVPMKLTIENTRERRLLTIYTQNVNSQVPYGADLRSIKQLNLSKTEKHRANLLTFVGPNKKIFRTASSATTQVVNFNLPITHQHFHEGHVKVLVGSSNGVQLTEICEVNNTECLTSATFKVVPRAVQYSLVATDKSYFFNPSPNQKFKILKSNVDVQVNENNVQKAIVSRKKLPAEFLVAYVTQKFRPHLVNSAMPKSRVNNMDIYPVIYYMSSNAYKPSDVIISTHSSTRPDITVRNAARAVKILQKK
ncbi:MAG: hypothetical protein DRQ51_01245 [Gammaproteobacteria bacterium]|nr:MAG: hypothetical protein DRQ51_01245 [Gammaproteobacteria bacterium]